MWFRTLSPQPARNVTVQYAPDIGVRQQSVFAFGMERAPAVRTGGKRFHSPPRFRRMRQAVLGDQRRKTRRDQGTLRISLWGFRKCPPVWLTRCGKRRGHYDIENATARLDGMLDGRKATSPPKRSRAASGGRAARGARHPMR